MISVESMRRGKAAGIFLALGLTAAGPGAARAQSEAQFFKGKTIDLYIGFSAGGGYDAYARLVAHFMGPHIPGRPTILAINMPGGGSRVASNFLFNVAPKDGTALAMVDQATPVQQAVGDPTIKFDCNAFNWIGNPVADNNVVVTWYKTGVKTIADAQKKQVALGSTGFNTSSQYPEAMNSILGTKFKVIFGYPGGNDINLAMENGEVGGRGSNSWASWKATRPEWVRDHKLNVLVQIGLKKAADLPGVPLLMDLATKPIDKAALKVLSAPPTIGRPIFAPPGVSSDRVKILRAAFDATMKDPAFIAEAKKERLDLDPVSGVELQKIVGDIVGTPKNVADHLSQIIAVKQDGSSSE